MMTTEGAEASTGREQQKAELTGSGAIAQGAGAISVGERGVNVGGDVLGGINTGDYYAAPKPTKPPYIPPELPDSSSLAKHGPLPPGSYLPHERNSFFTGRSTYLLDLAQTLLYERGDVVVTQTAVASGLGGIGKTQLAVEFAHRYGQFFEGGVYWLNCENPVNIPAEVALMGGPQGMGLYQQAEQLTLDEQVGLVRQAWQEATPRLLIFDNCEAVDVLTAWRPKAGGCRVLVTSRRGTWEGELGVRHVPLDVLDRPESIALLRRFVPQMAEEDANNIAAELGDLPLALHLAGSYLRAYKGVSPAGYLAQLRDQQLLDHASLQGRGTEYSPTAHEMHVGRTFALSFKRLDPDNETDATALALLARAACFASGEAFPSDWLLAALQSDDELLPLDGLKRLVALGLLTAEGESGYQLHRLLAMYVQQMLKNEMAAAQGAVEEVVVQQAYKLYMTGYPTALLPWQNQLRHVAEAAAIREDVIAAALLNNLGAHLQANGDYAGTKGYYEQVLAIHEQALGPQHPDTAISLNNLGTLLQAMGDLAAARPLLERALAVNERALGPQHHLTATSLNNLGKLLQDMGDLTAARPLLERALAIREKVLGPEHPSTASSLNKLGGLLKELGNLAAARPLYERALAINEQALGPQHPATATSLAYVGLLLQELGDLAAARPLLERALAVNEQSLGPQHPFTVTGLNNLGLLLKDMGDLAAARPLLERALAIREQTLGPNHPDTAQSLNNLGMLLQEIGDLATARPLLERALTISEKVLGSDHPDTAQSLNNLGILLHTMGDLAAARPFYERALAIWEQVLGPEHPNTRIARDNLAALDRALKRKRGLFGRLFGR